MRTVVVLGLIVLLSAARVLAGSAIDTSGARPLLLKVIPITSSSGTEFLIDRLHLYPDLCADGRGDLLFVSGVRGVYHFRVHNGTAIQDTTARYEPFISYHTMPYEADGVVPTEYINPDNSLLSCTASDDVPFSRYTGSVCDIVGTDDYYSADVTNDGQEDLIYGASSATDRYHIAIGGRVTSLQCDSIVHVPLIPTQHIVCQLVDHSSLYLIHRDSGQQKPGPLMYSRVSFDWNGALGQTGHVEASDSIIPPFDSATSEIVRSVYDHKEHKGYLWILWSSTSNRYQTIVYSFQGGSRLSTLTSIDGYLDVLEEAKGSTDYYKPIMKYGVSAYGRMYFASIDAIDKPFAYVTDYFPAFIHAALASDQDGDKYPDLIIWRNLGEPLLQYASIYNAYNRIDNPTAIAEPQNAGEASIRIEQDEIVIRGVEGPYSIELYSLLGASVAQPQILHGASRTALAPLLKGLPTQPFYVVVRSADKQWTFGYWK